MAEDMTFLPKSAVLSIEEMAGLAERFVARGIRRIRLTGGEPLVRRSIDTLAERPGAATGPGIADTTLNPHAMTLPQQRPIHSDPPVRPVQCHPSTTLRTPLPPPPP